MSDSDTRASAHADVAVDGPIPAEISRTAENSDVTPESSPQPLTQKVDLRSLEYISDFDRNIVCPICRCPFVDPVRLPCDHTFCRECLDTALFNQASSTKSCPSCRTRNVHLERLSVPRFILHMLDDLNVKCPKAALGCVQNLKRSDVQSHVDQYCGFTKVACPSDSCAFGVPRRLKGDKCLHSIVTCEYCQLEFLELDLVVHEQSTCSVKTAACEWCEEQVLVSEREKHLQECPLARHKCDAHAIGCHYESNKNDMQGHATTCPLLALLPTMKSLTRRMDDQNATIDALRCRNREMEDTLASIQGLVADSSSTQSIFPVGASLNSSSQPGLEANAAQAAHESPLFDSATHHMLSMHESLREELDRLSAAISEVDGRTSMALINETMRIREELTHANAAISSLRIQLQWLTSARLHAQQRGPFGGPAVPALASRAAGSASNDWAPPQPARRLSDSARQDTKL